MQPEVVPDADEFFRQHFEEGRQLLDIRHRKAGNPRRPDFRDRLTGRGIWLNHFSPWVLERLNGRQDEDLPDKVQAMSCVKHACRLAHAA